MVQSARVQSLVKGDDVTLTHQIMKSVAFNAEESRQPDPLDTGDVVKFYYPLQDPTQTDLIGYLGVPVGSLPESLFTVAIPGILVDPANLAPNRGNSTFKSGQGQTVRAEIFRLLEHPTGNTTLNSKVIASISSTTGLSPGKYVDGPGIPTGTVITAVGSGQITLSAAATATASGIDLTVSNKETQYLIQEVDIFERGFPTSLDDTSGGANPPAPKLNLT